MTTAGLVRAGRWPGRICAAASAALLATALLAAGAASGNSPASAASTPLQPPCAGARAAGPFSIASNNTEVLGGNGKRFLSYGTTVPGLLNAPTYKTGKNKGKVDYGSPLFNEPSYWLTFVKLDKAKMTATADDWCGNTIRIQASQDSLWGPNGNDFHMAYLEAIEEEVSFAVNTLHLVVVINDSSVGTRNQAGPTSLTEKFWTTMALIYGYPASAKASPNESVIFDLFNEPADNYPSLKTTWCDWRNGDATRHYIGMQTLANFVRNRLKAHNLFWVEGPHASSSFSGMELNCGLLSKTVGPVVYAIHHPVGLGPGNQQDRAAWYKDFGYLLNRGLAPVVEGEWTNYMPGHLPCPKALVHGRCQVAPPPSGTCWPNPHQIPVYLQYLADHGVGMSAYQLSKGFLITQDYNEKAPNPQVFRQPTMIYPNGVPPGHDPWNCDPYTIVGSSPDRGAGLLIMSWFRECNPQSVADRDCKKPVHLTP